MTGSSVPLMDCSAFQRDLLVLLAREQPINGLSLKKELSEAYDTQQNHERVYNNLNSLEDSGLVVVEAKNERTNLYSLSHEAHGELVERVDWTLENLESNQ